MVETTPEIQTKRLPNSFSLSRATALLHGARKPHKIIEAAPNASAFLDNAQLGWCLTRKRFPGAFSRSIGFAK